MGKPSKRVDRSGAKSDGAHGGAGNANTAVTSGNGDAAGPDSGSVVDLAAVPGSGDGGGQGDNGGKRGRGRPPGSTSRPKAAAPLSVEKFSQLLFVAHLMAANMSGIREIEIDNGEAGELSQSTLDLMKLYGINGPSEQTAAWLALIGVLGKVYGPRFTAYKMRKASERNEKRAADLNGGPGQPAQPRAQTVHTGGGLEPLASHSDPHTGPVN
jgi:hypothetical protein